MWPNLISRLSHHQVLMNACGLGGLSVNTVVLPFHEIPNVTLFGEAAHNAVEQTPEFYDQLIYRLEHEDDGPAVSPMTYGKGREEVGKVFIHPLSLPPLYRFNLPLAGAAEFCGLIRDALLLEKNVMLMRNFHGGVRGRKGRLYTHTSNRPNVDLWVIGEMRLAETARGLAPELLTISPSQQAWIDQRRRGWMEMGRFAHFSYPNLFACPLEIANGASVQADGTQPTSPDATSSTNAEQSVSFFGPVALLLQFGQVRPATRDLFGGFCLSDVSFFFAWQILTQARLGPGGMWRQRRLRQLRIFYVPGTPQANVGNAMTLLRTMCTQARIDILEHNMQVITLEQLRSNLPSYQTQCRDRNSLVPLAQLPPAVTSNILNNLFRMHSQNTCQVSEDEGIEGLILDTQHLCLLLQLLLPLSPPPEDPSQAASEVLN